MRLQCASSAALQALWHGMVTARSLLVCSLACSLGLVQLPSTKVNMCFGYGKHHFLCGASGLFLRLLSVHVKVHEEYLHNALHSTCTGKPTSVGASGLHCEMCQEEEC